MKVSVVTVCYNAVNTIEKTIKSVLEQTYIDVEYIIIDGGSTDGTVDIIRRYEKRISRWVSEPDKGIYDAMNKGINLASGEWVNFMNAGDLFYDKHVLENVLMERYPSTCLVVYGKTKINYRWGTYIVTPPKIETLRKRSTLCHQSTLIRLCIHKKRLYDLSYKIAADRFLFHSIYLDFSDAFVEYTGVVSIYDAIEGVSAKNVNDLHHEIEKISGRISFFEKSKKLLLNNTPNSVSNVLYRIYLGLNKRYKRV